MDTCRLRDSRYAVGSRFDIRVRLKDMDLDLSRSETCGKEDVRQFSLKTLQNGQMTLLFAQYFVLIAFVHVNQ